MLRLDDAGRQRVEDHMEVARRMATARRRRCPWIDLDDLIGAAYLGLSRASAGWKGKCPFEGFAVQVIDCNLSEEVERWHWKSRDAQLAEGGEEYLIEAAQLGDDEATQAAFLRLRQPQQDALSRHILRGESYAEVGQAIGRTREGARSLIRQSMRKFRKLLSAPAAVPA